MAVAVVGMLLSMWGCARSAETRSPKAAINQEPQQAAIHYVKVVQQELPDTLIVVDQQELHGVGPLSQ